MLVDSAVLRFNVPGVLRWEVEVVVALLTLAGHISVVHGLGAQQTGGHGEQLLAIGIVELRADDCSPGLNV